MESAITTSLVRYTKTLIALAVRVLISLLAQKYLRLCDGSEATLRLMGVLQMPPYLVIEHFY